MVQGFGFSMKIRGFTDRDGSRGTSGSALAAAAAVGVAPRQRDDLDCGKCLWRDPSATALAGMTLTE
jgi:hypothetical protein